jgi:hypothetical protein
VVNSHADNLHNRAKLTGKGSYAPKQKRSEEAFAGRHIRMLESPAHRVLSLAALRALYRIEVELSNHGGNENGELPVTFQQFEEWGVRRHSIASAIRELEALGFIEVTQHGYGGAAQACPTNIDSPIGHPRGSGGSTLRGPWESYSDVILRLAAAEYGF